MGKKPAKAKKILGDDGQGMKMLACMLRAAGNTREKYRTAGIDASVFIDTMKCFSRFVREHKNSFGVWGFDRDFWTGRRGVRTAFRRHLPGGKEMLLNIEAVIAELDLHKGSIVSVVGSGGKTTLIETLAEALCTQYRVCVAASTHMRVPPADVHRHLILKDQSGLSNPCSLPGIYYAADALVPGGKLSGFSPEMVQWAQTHTDIILIEADGSRSLPLKGWAEYEPVVIRETQMTIGVMPLFLLGQPVGPHNVHRFELFSQLTGAKDGDMLTCGHIVAAITGSRGLFAKAIGKKAMFFSQVNTPELKEAAALIAAKLRPDIDPVIIGSLRP